MKKLIVLIYIAAATLMFGYAKANTLSYTPAQYIPIVKSTHVTDLPVNFEDITANKVKSTAEINWATLSEHNNKQFEIQRRTEGQEFKTIAIVFTLENSNGVKNYKFKDGLKGVIGKSVTYRIKQVDSNEASTFSKVVSLDL